MKQSSYLPVIFTTLLFPVIANVIYFIRFFHLPKNVLSESMIFLPTGLISGIILVYFLRKATSERQQQRVMWGYVFAVPVAVLVLMLGGLIFPLLLTTLLLAVVPLVVGVLIGFVKK